MAQSSTLARVLVTGGQGFLGVYVIRHLLRQGSSVALLDVKENLGIARQVLTEEEIARVERCYVDIADGDAVKDVVLRFKPSAVIHLAGVQIPTVRANPSLGVSVNLAGTVNIFEAVRV